MCSRWHAVIAVALLTSTLGCQMSAEQQLIGRWYNSNLSLRFGRDGSVVYNSAAGLARGRYVFSGDVSHSLARPRQPNLELDVVRNGRRERLAFAASLMSDNRLGLYDLTAKLNPASSTDTTPQFALLRRAAENQSASALHR